MGVIIPAIVPQSRADLEDKLARLAEVAAVQVVQIDAVDGRYARPACWPYTGQGMLESLVRAGQLLPQLGRLAYDADLMVDDPERATMLWNALGATRLTLHAESASNLPRTIAAIRARHGQSAGFVPGLFELGAALGVHTPLELLLPHLGMLDYVQLMGIETIGAQGQPFARAVLPKLRALRAHAPRLTIQIDGGVTLDTAPELLAAGASRLVVGHALWQAPSLAHAIARFEALATPYGV